MEFEQAKNLAYALHEYNLAEDRLESELSSMDLSDEESKLRLVGAADEFLRSVNNLSNVVNTHGLL